MGQRSTRRRRRWRSPGRRRRSTRSRPGPGRRAPPWSSASGTPGVARRTPGRATRWAVRSRGARSGWSGCPRTWCWSPCPRSSRRSDCSTPGLPFHAHEVLEASWKAAPEAERELWQGLAQLAVGLTHVLRGNPTGATTLLQRARRRIVALRRRPAVRDRRRRPGRAGATRSWLARCEPVRQLGSAPGGRDGPGPARLRARRPPHATTRSVAIVGSAAYAMRVPAARRGLEARDGLGGDPLPRRQDGDARRVGRDELGRDPPDGLVDAEGGRRGEEGVARRQHDLGPDAPARRDDRLARRTGVPARPPRAGR